MKEQLQTITLYFDGGGEAHYLGKFQIDPNNLPKITAIDVSLPRELRDDCHWTKLEEITNKGTTP